MQFSQLNTKGNKGFTLYARSWRASFCYKLHFQFSTKQKRLQSTH